MNLQRPALPAGLHGARGLAPTVSSLIPRDGLLLHPQPCLATNSHPHGGCVDFKIFWNLWCILFSFPCTFRISRGKRTAITGQWTATVSARTQKPHCSVRGPGPVGGSDHRALRAVLRIQYTNIYNVFKAELSTGVCVCVCVHVSIHTCHY